METRQTSSVSQSAVVRLRSNRIESVTPSVAEPNLRNPPAHISSPRIQMATSMMPPAVSIYDLFDKRGFRYWEREISQGRLPTSTEFADLLEANRDTELPSWLTAIRDHPEVLKRRTGRPRNSALKQIRLQLAIEKYPRYLHWLKNRERSLGLSGWPYVCARSWWAGPPHERAARMAIARWLRHMSWRAFLNRISSEKRADLL